MKSLIFIGLSFFCIANAKVSTCDLCARVEKLNAAYEEDQKKAYNEFNSLLSQVKLSKDKKVLGQEIESLLKTSVAFLESDERQELPDFLADISEKHPKEFKAALAVLPTEKREDIENRIKIAQDLMKDGEEPSK